jgi:O-antigen ligase
MSAIHELPVESKSKESKKDRRLRIITGAMLILFLAFTTSTVFVQQVWAIDCFQIGIYALTAAYVLFDMRRNGWSLAQGIAPLLVYLIPLWGVVQIVAHWTASTVETREEVLRWGALAAVFFITQVIVRTRSQRENLLKIFVFFATAMAVLCLTQLFTSQGNVLWIFASGYPDVYATFPNHNNYAEFIELFLPIALWWALRDGWRAWGYALIAGVLYASVIGAASRAGAIICTAEFLAVLILGLVLHVRPKPGRSLRLTTTTLIAVPMLAAVFTFIVGWRPILDRFQKLDPQVARREFFLSAVDMARHRPLTGYGLGTFPEAYQQHAIRDFPFYANHAHNDWAEFAADGGIPFFLLIVVPFAAAIPIAIRHPWGIGLVAVMLHACVDYPFPRPAVSGWMFAMLALLYMARSSDRRKQDSAQSSGPERAACVVQFTR